MDRSRLSVQEKTRAPPLSDQISLHSELVDGIKEEALPCLVGFILLPFWAGLNCAQSQQNYDSIKTIS